MLLAVVSKLFGRKLFGRKLFGRAEPRSSGAGPAADPTSEPAPIVSSEPAPDPRELEAERLWRAARDELQPFRKDAMLREVARMSVRAHGEALRRYCATQAASDGDDLAQRAFLLYWQKLPGFEGRSTLRTFLFGIAFNLCRQSRRDHSRDAALTAEHSQDILDGVHPEREVSLDDEVDRARRRQRVHACVARLDAKDAWLIRKRLVEQLDYHEILPLYRASFGARITTPEGLRTAFFHAKARLLASLEEIDHG